MAADEMLLQITDMIKGLANSVERLSEDLSDFKGDVNNRFDKMDERFDGIDERLDKLENQVTENYNAIEQLMRDQKDMRNEITEIQLRMENDIQRNFSILSESAISDADRLHDLEERVQITEDNYEIDAVIDELRMCKLI